MQYFGINVCCSVAFRVSLGKQLFSPGREAHSWITVKREEGGRGVDRVIILPFSGPMVIFAPGSYLDTTLRSRIQFNNSDHSTSFPASMLRRCHCRPCQCGPQKRFFNGRSRKKPDFNDFPIFSLFSTRVSFKSHINWILQKSTLKSSTIKFS